MGGMTARIRCLMTLCWIPVLLAHCGGSPEVEPDVAVDVSEVNGSDVLADTTPVDADVILDSSFPDETESVGSGVGEPCTANQDCLTGLCYTHPPGGYCTQLCDDATPCPADSSCVQATGQEMTFCYKNCASDQECREDQWCGDGICNPNCKLGDCPEGYICNFETGQCDSTSTECVPSSEECNGLDDDCDNYVDEGCFLYVDLPPGVELLDLGIVGTGAGLTSPDVEFEIGPDVESFTLIVLGDDESYLLLTKFEDPNGLSLINVDAPYQSVVRVLPSQGAVTAIVPNAPATYLPVAGTYTVSVLRQGSYVQVPIVILTKGAVSTVEALSSDFDDGNTTGWLSILESTYGTLAWGTDDVDVFTGSLNTAVPWDMRDLPHESLLVRSDPFTLTGKEVIVGAMGGGRGGAGSPRDAMDTNPIDSTEDDFMGLALRRVSDGSYLESRRRPGNGNTYRFVSLQPTEIAELIASDAEDETYTIDLIDEYHGSWGFSVIGALQMFEDPQKLDINIHFVGIPDINAQNHADHVKFSKTLERFFNVIAQAGIVPGTITAYDITGDDAQKYTYLDKSVNGLGELPELLALSEMHPASNALNLFFVQNIANIDTFHTLGISGGIPGPPLFQGTQSSGVVVALPADFSTTLVAHTMAHEVGHYLGLFHTTEKTGTLHDPLTDTLECSDSNDDGLAGADDCHGIDVDNLMFWSASGSTMLSAQQGTVLRGNPQTYGSEE